MRGGEVVSGRVTELRFVASNPAAGQQSSRGGQARGESPVVAYTTRAGEQRSMIGSVNRYPAPWKIGDTVDVVYDPANPDRADLRTEVAGWRLWFGIWCAVAVLPAAFAMVPIVLRLRQRPPGLRQPGESSRRAAARGRADVDQRLTAESAENAGQPWRPSANSPHDMATP